MTLTMIRPSDQWELINSARKRAPVDVVGLAYSLGLQVKQAFLSPQVSGMIEKSGDSYLITINHLDPVTRQRFTVAHELGHYMLHRHLIGNGLAEDRAYRSTTVGKYHNTRIGPREETEANKFAANLLMPMELIKADRAAGMTMREMAKKYGVSEHAMSIRLGLPY